MKDVVTLPVSLSRWGREHAMFPFFYVTQGNGLFLENLYFTGKGQGMRELL